MMILPNKKDALHKSWLYRTLEAIADDRYLASVLYFKGGTCASMLGWLDRFSVDLDFDYAGKTADIPKTRAALESIFRDLGLIIHDSSKKGIQYFLRYENLHSGRTSIKIDVSFPLFVSSVYEPQRFVEIDRMLICQTRDTMFAHKLVAIIDRFEKTGHIAGRDIYDIHYFFMNGYGYNSAVIKERRSTDVKSFLAELADFIEKHVTDKVITEDLSHLLTPEKYALLRKVLKREVVSLVRTASVYK
jgi:predicted nucleotidyltransferase component of viral defense system